VHPSVTPPVAEPSLLRRTSLLRDSARLTSDFHGHSEALGAGGGAQSNTTIRSLSLNQNCIGPRGVELLVKALRENTGVAMLDLGANLLGPDGCAALAPIFVPDRFERKFNSTLLALNLSSNSLYHRIYMDAAGNHQLSEDCSGIQTLTAALFRPYANGLRDTHATLVLNLQVRFLAHSRPCSHALRPFQSPASVTGAAGCVV
jgi:hypothetical protein